MTLQAAPQDSGQGGCLRTYVGLRHSGLALDHWLLQLLPHSTQQLAQTLNVLSTRRLVVSQQALDAAAAKSNQASMHKNDQGKSWGRGGGGGGGLND
jgi:hypothetical protein